VERGKRVYTHTHTSRAVIIIDSLLLDETEFGWVISFWLGLSWVIALNRLRAQTIVYSGGGKPGQVYLSGFRRGIAE
jgi:hypothetical protein